MTNEIEDKLVNFFNFRLEFKIEKILSEPFRRELTHSLKGCHYGLAHRFTFLSEPVRLPDSEDVWFLTRSPYVYTLGYEYLLQVPDCVEIRFSRFVLKKSPFCHKLSNLMSPFNKHVPSEHLYKRPWKPSEYLKGAIEEELIQCQKSVYLEQSNQLEFKYTS